MQPRKDKRMGSPPRMRGKVYAERHKDHYTGITPAYAGKSLPSRACPPSCWDHPRVCGEKHIRVVCGCTRVGSPPRMRGKEAAGKLCSPGRGITPAYAGKSEQAFPVDGRDWDHPRVCGEKSSPTSSHRRGQGSPPRMRGKAGSGGQCPERSGITPAYAGKRLKRSHSIGHFSCILCLFHSVLHRASASGGSRAGPCAPPCLPAQNAIPV